MSGTRLVGRPQVRVDALAKACGVERYAGDFAPGDIAHGDGVTPLVAGAKRAGLASGRLVRVDVRAALATPGVVAVLTGADVPGSNRQGFVHPDQPVIATDWIGSAADPVALVVAEDRAALRLGLSRIVVEIEPAPGVFDPEAALAPGAPLVHPEREGGNLLHEAVVGRGEAEATLAAAPVRVAVELVTPWQEHAFLETQNGLARLDEQGGLDMIVSSQAPFRDRFEIGAALGLNPLAIRVRAPYLGGGFGGKDGATVQCLLGLAALHACGRWVRMVWEREESLLAGFKRHPARIRLELGAEADGTLVALAADALFDSGAYAHLGVEIMALGLEHASGGYRIPHTRIRGRIAYTNNPVGGAFRGFGALQTVFAMERAMDALAAKLGADPLELRLKNALKPGEANGVGVVPDGPLSCLDCLLALAEHPLWRDRAAFVAAAPPRTRRAVGVSSALNAVGYGRGLPDAAVAKLELDERGRFLLYNGVPDMGQGNAAAYALIAAEILNQPPEIFTIIQPDTARCHPSGSSSASRTTYGFGKALEIAARRMADKLKARAALTLHCDEPGRLILEAGAVSDPHTGGRVELVKLGAFLIRDDRIVVAEHVMPVVDNPPDSTKAFRLGFPHRIYGHAAHVAAVEIDELTGAVRLLASVTAVDGGRPLNPVGIEQQIEGAVGQGAGFALMENMVVRDGVIATPDLSTYLIPTALDLGEAETRILHGEEASGPFGLKGIGEVGMHGPLAAIAQAVDAALGMVNGVDRLPLSPEWVLDRLEEGR